MSTPATTSFVNDAFSQQLDEQGYAIVPGLLGDEHVYALRGWLSAALNRPQTLPMENDKYRAEVFCFDEPPPAPLAIWRQTLYRQLYPLANRWNKLLGMRYRYPVALESFVEQNHQAGQHRSQSHLVRLRAQGYQALTHYGQGSLVFPLQVIALLSEPGKDFTGGEFVMTEHRPRMQSRPMVLPLRCGDIAVIATAARPVKGARAYYRVKLKHAISRVHSGERIGLELLFHHSP
ncbi:2OG-Fe(II) oxygenase [Allopusillimonas ginsengisoli]|uniref:2OG-Fe(II) oxygenase n=1 Tax=Allopusillimonas ginsengisoli TaxID=453575 RepID=UPI0010219FCA|nr:2OG-Fe(II) oxygenase [Allopusillimonas ginsengisoli]TEA80047.1 prolyl 4-hydroxylase [Allopusillimonas ginsengisoli]